MSTIIDISPPIDAHLAVWPGDVPFERIVAMDIDQGDHLSLSAIKTAVHLGAHADAPHHYAKDERGIGHVALEPYLGPCQVLHVDVGRGQRIRPEHLMEDIRQPRVLFATNTYPDPRKFNRDFAALSPELLDLLASKHVCLVGIDTPSIDLEDSKALESHNALYRHRMSVLEGVVLGHVPAGDYTLIALPLPLLEADASPVRAVLMPLG